MTDHETCEATVLLKLVFHAAADDGHELGEHLHPEIAGMVRSFLARHDRHDARPVQPNKDPGPLWESVE